MKRLENGQPLISRQLIPTFRGVSAKQRRTKSLLRSPSPDGVTGHSKAGMDMFIMLHVLERDLGTTYWFAGPKIIYAEQLVVKMGGLLVGLYRRAAFDFNKEG